MKKLSAAAILMVLVCSYSCTNEPKQESTNTEVATAFEDQYINLQGEWHFRVYRKYENMFQLFNHGGVNVVWEDLEVAKIPTTATCSSWETVTVPSPNYSTGGLQQMRRGTDMDTDDDRTRLSDFDVFPNWSEAWFCRTIEIPKGFLVRDNVTLLLSIIDDLDVVYINGKPIGAKGFVTSDGTTAPPSNVPAAGGFSPEGEFRFESSYWEVPREYVIDTSLLHEGTNQISVRVYNNNSFGGFYDRTMALVATNEALRHLKGLPTKRLEDNTSYASVVATQRSAIESQSLEVYGATLSESYIENELDKKERLEAMETLFRDYANTQVSDTNGGFYWYNGAPVYSAKRLVTGDKDGKRETILSDDQHLQYFTVEKDYVTELGNHSHCYTVDYVSSLDDMQGATLTYNIYLPPSYYKDPDRTYPVVYLLHGVNSTGDSFVKVDRIEQRMNEWIADGSVVEMIVVMPNSGKRSGYADADAPNGPNDTQGPWASHIYIDIRNEIESNYRAIADARFRGLTGISMGGGGVFKIGLAHPDIYTSFATHMGAVRNVAEYAGDLTAAIVPTLDFYIDHGNQDNTVNPKSSVAAADYLENIGANVEFELRNGGHNSAFYMAGMPKSMATHSRHFLKNGLKPR